jgi:hypothetical protein
LLYKVLQRPLLYMYKSAREEDKFQTYWQIPLLSARSRGMMWHYKNDPYINESQTHQYLCIGSCGRRSFNRTIIVISGLWHEWQEIDHDWYWPKTAYIRMFKLSHVEAIATYGYERRAASWRIVAEEHSQSSLTPGKDMLLCILGIAKDVALPEMERCVAGLWEQQSPQALH